MQHSTKWIRPRNCGVKSQRLRSEACPCFTNQKAGYKIHILGVTLVCKSLISTTLCCHEKFEFLYLLHIVKRFFRFEFPCFEKFLGANDQSTWLSDRIHNTQDTPPPSASQSLDGQKKKKEAKGSKRKGLNNVKGR